MKDKKVIILIVLAIVAVISLIHGMTARPKKAIAVESMVSQTTVPAMPKETLTVERQYKRSTHTSWKRSPFVPTSTSTSSKLVVSGIIWSKDKPKAMIGDAMVGKGDKVGNNTVVEIKPDKVILNDGTKDFELKLEK